MQKERLLKRINSYFIVHTLTKVFSFCLVLLYAFYISTDELGEYEYIQTLINIIVPFFFLSVWESILKFGLKEEKYTKLQVIGTSTFLTIISTVLLTISCIIWFAFNKENNVWYIMFVILTYVLDALVVIWQHYLKTLNEYNLYVKSATIGSITSIILVCILVIIFKLQLEALFISSVIGMFVTFVIIERESKILKYLRKDNIDIKLLKDMIKYSLPLVVSAGLTWLVTGFSKTVIQNYISADANGIYSFAHKFTIIITFVSTIVSTAITEEMLTLSKEKFKEEFSKVTEKLFETFFVIATMAMPLIMGFYRIIETTEYYASKQYVALLIFYFIFLTMAGNVATIFKMYGKNKFHMLATLIGAIVTVTTIIFTLNKLGIMGVVLSQLIGTITIFVFVVVLGDKYVKLDIKYLKILKFMLLYSLVSIITYIGNIYVIILTCIFTLIYFKDSILNIFKEYKGRKSEESIQIN